jgi:type II secretory pathway component PulK
MRLYPHLAAEVTVLLVLAVVAGLVALGTIGTLVVTHRRTRLARHQSMRTYYRGLVLSH